MPETEAHVLDNLIPRSGRLVMRGPATLIADLSLTHYPLNVIGAVGLAPGDFIGQRTTTNRTDSAMMPQVAGLVTPSTASTTLLAVANNGTVTTVVTTRDRIPGWRWINFDGLMYGISADATAAVVGDVNGTYQMAPLNLLSLNGSALTTAPTVMASAPKGALDLTGYLSRIWLLGGVDTPGAGTYHSSTAIFFTNPIVSGGGGVASDWQDPVTGLTNQIVMDRDQSDPGVGLAKVQNGLLILRRRSIWLLRGTTSASFTLVRINSETGCMDPRSIVQTDQGVYFLSDKGLMLCNGIRTVNVSGPVRYTLTAALTLSRTTSIIPYGGAIQCALLSDGSILVSVVAATGTGPLAPIWCGCYDPSTGAWWRLTSQLWAPDGFPGGGLVNLYPSLFVAYAPQHRVNVLGDQYVTQLESYQASAGTGIVGPHAGNNVGWYDDSNSAPAFANRYLGIPAGWTTRAMPLDINAIARKYGQAKRFFLDYVAQSRTDSTGWTVVPIDPTYTSLTTSPLLAPGLTMPTFPLVAASLQIPGWALQKNIQRANQDFSAEISDVQFKVLWSNAAGTTATAPPTNAIAEILGVGIEFQPARDLR